MKELSHADSALSSFLPRVQMLKIVYLMLILGQAEMAVHMLNWAIIDIWNK